MATHGKKYRESAQKIHRGVMISAPDALKKVKELAYAKFDESVDVDVNLGIDASKGDQTVRGSLELPHGRGHKARVIVFAKGDAADQAVAAGADAVGVEDLIEKIKGGWLEFDYAVATPDLMGAVGVLAKVLGPRGLLPNKKLGTVTFEAGNAVKELKKGKVFFKNDKGGIVHFTIGKVSFDANKLQENLVAFLKALNASRPPTAKGKFIKKAHVSSTMGVGFWINADELLHAA